MKIDNGEELANNIDYLNTFTDKFATLTSIAVQLYEFLPFGVSKLENVLTYAIMVLNPLFLGGFIRNPWACG